MERGCSLWAFRELTDLGLDPVDGWMRCGWAMATKQAGSGACFVWLTGALKSESIDAEELSLVSLAQAEGYDAGNLRRGRRACEAAGQ